MHVCRNWDKPYYLLQLLIWGAEESSLPTHVMQDESIPTLKLITP